MNSPPQNTLSTEYLPDSTAESKDCFERREFARRLADTIVKRGQEECLTVSIVGSWGSGKSTVLKMMETELSSRTAEQGTCKLVSFNPWKYSGQDTLLYHLFEAIVLGIDPGRELLTRWQSIKRNASKARRWAGPIAAVASNLKAPGSGALTGGLVNALLPEEFKAKVDELKENTSKHLLDSELRMVVLLDDVDRLEAEEILLLFRSLKLVADLPNTTFVIAMDEDHVSQIIGRQLDGKAETGRRYLEKIINVRLHLPVIPPEVLEEHALETFTAIWTRMRPEGLSQKDRKGLRSVFGRLHAPFLRTPRTVKSIANAFHFSLGLLPGDLNPGDVLLLEATRLLHPLLYEKLQEVIPGLPSSDDFYTYQRRQVEKQTPKQLAREALSACLTAKTEKAMDALVAWFPQLSDGMSEVQQGQHLCNPEYFWRYFSMAIHKKDVHDGSVRQWSESAALEPEKAEADLAGHLRSPYSKVFVRKLTRLCPESWDVRRAVIGCFAAVVSREPEFREEAGLSGSFFYNSLEMAEQWLKDIPGNERGEKAANLVESIPWIDWNMMFGQALREDQDVYNLGCGAVLDEILARQSLAAYQQGDLPADYGLIAERIGCLYRQLDHQAIREPLLELVRQQPDMVLQILVGGCSFRQRFKTSGWQWDGSEGLAEVARLISPQELKERLTAVLSGPRPDIQKSRHGFDMHTLEEVGWLCLDTIAEAEKAGEPPVAEIPPKI